MPTREIPRHEWSAFLDSFTAVHRGWLVDVELLDPVLGDEVSAQSVPLIAATAGGPNEVELLLGEPHGATLTRVMKSVQGVWLQQSEEGADQSLAIDLGGGSKVLLRFPAPVLPELVDGVLAE